MTPRWSGEGLVRFARSSTRPPALTGALKRRIRCQDQFTTDHEAPFNISREDGHPVAIEDQAAGREVA